MNIGKIMEEDIQNMYKAIVSLGLINWIKTYDFLHVGEYDKLNISKIYKFPNVNKHGNGSWSIEEYKLRTVKNRIIKDYSVIPSDIKNEIIEEDIHNMYNAVVDLGLKIWLENYNFVIIENQDQENINKIFNYKNVNKYGHTDWSFEYILRLVKERIINNEP